MLTEKNHYNQQLNIYLVSDSSGETVGAVSKAAYTQFVGLETVEYMWPLVRSKQQVDTLIIEVKQRPGIILHTMINNEVRSYLIDKCVSNNIPCICPIQPIIELISDYAQLLPNKNIPGKYNKLDDDYFKRIESLNYTIMHDDGQYIQNYNQADIVLLGVSRTSKSPTSFYLSQRGYKVANLPIIPGIKHDLSSLNNPLIVGLNISLEQLLNIRRYRFLGNKIDSVKNNYCYNKETLELKLDNYLSISAIKEELSYSRQLFTSLNIPVVDVTRKAIEEVAAEIINLLFVKRGTHR